MELGIKHKVMIVTGGWQGIGEGIARFLAAEGAIPVIAGRTKAANTIKSDFEKDSIKAHFIETDLASAENCKKIVDETLEKFGRVDALINNAGKNDGAGLEHGSPEKFHNSIVNNLNHYYNMAYYCLESLKKTKGSIVNISSKTALTGQGNTSGYAASKGAQLALTREWAAELLPYSIRVNAVIPAEVMTPLYRTWINTFPDPDTKLKDITSKIPLERRMTTDKEIASMVAYLVSEQSSHITGQFLFVDGGYVHLDRIL